MWFRVNKTVPANTTEQTALETRLVITQGTIIEWDVGAPEEAANLLKLQVFYRGSKIVPFGDANNIYPSAVKSSKKESYKIDQPPYELLFRVWNEDDSYDHEYWCDVVILREEEVTTAVSSPSLIERITDFFSNIAGVFFEVFYYGSYTP